MDGSVVRVSSCGSPNWWVDGDIHSSWGLGGEGRGPPGDREPFPKHADVVSRFLFWYHQCRCSVLALVFSVVFCDSC